jgi:hypothetical protein
MAGLDTLKKQINNAIGLIVMAGGDPNKATPNKEGYYDNPGNIEANTTSFASTGKTYGDGRFAQFENKVFGLNAIPYTFITGAYDDVRDGNILDVKEAIEIYKPIGENTEEEVKNQITAIQKRIDGNELDLSNKDHVMILMEEITRYENKDSEKALKYYNKDARSKAADLFLSPIKPKPKRK